MESMKDFEFLRVLSYLLVPLVMALLLPRLAGSGEQSRTSLRLRQVLIVLPALLAIGYTYLFFFRDTTGGLPPPPGGALPPLPGIVWCLFVVYVANFLADRYRAGASSSEIQPLSLPLRAWMMLAIVWLLSAATALILLPYPPALAGYMVLSLGVILIVSGPAILSRLSFRPIENPQAESPAARGDPGRWYAWQVFGIIGIMAFGKIALAVVITLDRAAVLGGNPVQAGRYTWIILATLALYSIVFLLCCSATRRRLV